MIDLKKLEQRFDILFNEETHKSFEEWKKKQKPLDGKALQVLNECFSNAASKTPTRL